MTLIVLMLGQRAIPVVLANDYVWIRSTGGVWSSPMSWEPIGVPGSDDSASVGPLTSGGINLNLDADVRTLSLGPVTISGVGWLSADQVNLSGTTFHGSSTEDLSMSGPRQVTINSLGLISGTVTTSRKIINFGSTTNYGTVQFQIASSNQYSIGEGPSWINESQSELWIPGGTSGPAFDFNPNRFSGVTPLPIQIPWLTNKSNAVIGKYLPGSAFIAWCFQNFGEVRVLDGELTFQRAGLLSGKMFVNLGAKLYLRNSPYTDATIDSSASFEGAGTVVFDQNGNKPFILDSPQPIANPVEIINSGFDGSGITFLGPVNWTALRGVGSPGEFAPINFLSASIGKGDLSRNVQNFGVAIDDEITPTNGVVWVNMPFSQFLVSDKSSPTRPGRGTFSNLFGAIIDLGNARDRNWNIINEGQIIGLGAGRLTYLNGSLQNNETGEFRLRGGHFIITNQFGSEGLVTGYGAVTAAVVNVSGTVSPDGTGGPFGRIAFASTRTSSLTFDANTVFKIDLGAGTNDQIHAQGASGPGSTANFKGRFDLTARDGFGPGDYLLATYLNILSSRAGPFTLGAVPPFYRYRLTNNASRGEIHLIVTAPEAQVVTLRSGSGGGGGETNLVTLDIATLTNTPYRIEYTSDLGDGWQLLTNIFGDGQSKTISPLPPGPAGYFKIIEGTPQ